jgi:hypothetical protein
MNRVSISLNSRSIVPVFADLFFSQLDQLKIAMTDFVKDTPSHEGAGQSADHAGPQKG